MLCLRDDGIYDDEQPKQVQTREFVELADGTMSLHGQTVFPVYDRRISCFPVGEVSYRNIGGVITEVKLA